MLLCVKYNDKIELLKRCRTMLLKFLALSLFIFISQPSWAAVWTVTYPRPEFEDDSRNEFPVALLELALQKTGVRYELKASDSTMRQSRALKRLEDNLEINILWSMTDSQRELQLKPIRIPITRGLIGWRVFLTHKNSPFLHAKINDLSDLLKYSPVQGIGWPDTKILQANGFNVVTARDYVEATEILNNKLADFFPRSVIEVLPELKNQYSTDFRLRNDIVINYPTAFYFFTNNSNLTLSRLVETGLTLAIEDGSYDELFMQHYGETLELLDIKNATYYKLENPNLPPLTPIENQRYWYFPVNVIEN